MADFDVSDLHDHGHPGGGFFSRLFSWIGWFFYYLFICIAGLMVLGLVLSIPAFVIFSLYVSSAITIPWITAFLVGAGLAHSLALFIAIMMVPMVYIAMAVAFVQMVDSINQVRGKKTLSHYLKEKRGSLLQSPVLWFAFLSLIFGIPTGIGVGIYLSVLIIPAAITSIMAMGVSTPLATFAGIFLAFGLVVMSIIFFLAPNMLIDFYLITPKKEDIHKDPAQALAILGTLAGLAIGIYSATMLYPILLTALTTLAITHATAVLASLILVFSLVMTITSLVHMSTSGLALLFSYNHDEHIQLDHGGYRPATHVEVQRHQAQGDHDQSVQYPSPLTGVRPEQGDRSRAFR